MRIFRRAIVATITRRYPFLSGCGTFANMGLVRTVAGRCDETVWARVPGGLYVLAPLNDYVGRAVYFAGDIDRKITRICQRIVRPGDTVLDIGANLGLVTFTLASLVGATGRVHSFEPNPAMVTLLKRALQKNGTSNVTVHATALGAEPGQLRLSIPAGNAGKASLLRRSSPTTQVVLVPVDVLSRVLADAKIGRIRLVKLDVEGFEAEVLSGARAWFAAHPPDAIVFEFADSMTTIADHPIITILEALGYEVFGIPKVLFRLRLIPVGSDEMKRASCHDLLAIHSRARNVIG